MLYFRVALLTSGIGTVAALALRAGIERTRLSRCLSGELRWRPGERERIAAILGRSVEELFPDLVTNKPATDPNRTAVSA